MKGPFEHAKVGDWIIDSTGDCRQITAIEEGEWGGVIINKHCKFFWDGQRPGRRKNFTTASLATAKEVAAWKKQQDELKAKLDRDAAEERRLERIRDAAPELLAALKKVTAMHCRPTKPRTYVDHTNAMQEALAAIAKATGKPA